MAGAVVAQVPLRSLVSAGILSGEVYLSKVASRLLKGLIFSDVITIPGSVDRLTDSASEALGIPSED